LRFGRLVAFGVGDKIRGCASMIRDVGRGEVIGRVREGISVILDGIIDGISEGVIVGMRVGDS
jgi:hypothetical protein